jgi:hypothetical protein
MDWHSQAEKVFSLVSSLNLSNHGNGNGNVLNHSNHGNGLNHSNHGNSNGLNHSNHGNNT